MRSTLQIGRKTALLSCVLLAVSLARALDPSRPIKEYVHRSWTSADGLPSNAVTAITQTRDGYLWFGTDEGLARFDGHQFTIFDRGNTPGLNGNAISVLLEDSQEDALWIGTYRGGLTRYSKGQFHAYSLQNNLLDVYVTALAQDNRGNLWIGTPKGLAVLRSGAVLRYGGDPELGQGAIVALAAAPDGGMWVATSSHVLKLGSDGKTKQSDLMVHDPSALFLSRRGALWIGSANHGLYSFSNGRLDHYPQPQLASSQIMALREDAAGNLWVALLNDGLCRVQAGHTECYTEKEGLISNTVLSVFEDHEGTLWIGTISGSNRLTDSKFNTLNKSSGLSQDVVVGLYQSPDGDIWAGTMDGLNQLRQSQIRSYRAGPKRIENIIITIASDGAGNLWVGTAAGLKMLRGGRLVPYGEKYGLANAAVHALFYDRADSMWIATAPDQLFRFHDGRLTKLTIADGIASTSVYSIMPDHQGSLWFATTSGFSRLQDGRFSNYKIPGFAGGANCFYEDSDHVLWVGTSTSALIRFQDGKIDSIPMKDGLSDGIWSILEDSRGYLWMTSNRGLFRIRKADLNDYAAHKSPDFNYISYGTADGLPSSEFNGSYQATALKAADGKLYFANLRGIVIVDPEHMPTNVLPPPVVIEEATSGKVERLPSGSRLVGEDDLQFHFAALSFVAPEDVSYKYKLEGYDANWVFSRNGRVTYTNLPPGKYRFRVIAANNDGVWNSEGATFDVTLKPVLYKTGWFIGLCALGCVFGGVGVNALRIYRMRATERRLVVMVNEQTRDLREAKEAAEAAAQAKSDFLANISHEIRTPLNGVMGMLQIVKQTQLSTDQTDCLNIADQSASALLTLINDVLDFSKIDDGRMELNSERLDPAAVIEDAVRASATAAHAKNLELCCSISPLLRSSLLGDSARLKQVLLNLISNAIKFTEKGEITVSADGKNGLDGKVQLHVSVTDTGIGIAPEHQRLIFESFSQADTSHTRRFGGAGLGLAISSRLAALMGGRVWVESELGNGSRFHFTALLKSVPDDGTQTSLRKKPNFKGCSALIVDDNATSRTILQEILESWDMSAVAVDSPAAGVAYLGSHACDVVLMDAETPGTNGLEMMRTSTLPDRMRSVIVMLSANGYHDQFLRCCEMGTAACLMKPVRQSELAGAVTTILSPDQPQHSREAPEVAPSPASSQAPLKILLAEDNLVNQKLAVRLLEKVGHKVAVAENGKQALLLVDNSEFDIVLMDVQMPEMDGLAATRSIRERERKTGKHLPIVAVTAHAMNGDRDRCLEAGMDEYLSKPIKAKELYQMIDYVLACRSMPRQQDQPVSHK